VQYQLPPMRRPAMLHQIDPSPGAEREAAAERRAPHGEVRLHQRGPHKRRHVVGPFGQRLEQRVAVG
jgi:hypothetical protein